MIPFEKIALVGSGNVAYAYSNVLKNNGINVSCIYTRNPENNRSIEKDLGIPVTNNYEDLLDTDIVIIAVKDDSIALVSENFNDYKGLLLHTSGTKPSSILNDVENHGVLYPLQTFTKDRNVDFRKVPLLINASSAQNLERLKALAERMSDIVIHCSDTERLRIHAAAVYVSNFVNVMLQIGSKILDENSLHLSLLESLVRETVDKSFAIGPEKALTGPAKRADYETIKSHIRLLENNIDEKEIYELLTSYIIKHNRK